MAQVTIAHQLPIYDEHKVMGSLLELPGVTAAEFSHLVFNRVAEVSFDSRITEDDVLAHLTGGIAPQAQIIKTDNLI